jgi:hypothetical protein
MLAGQAAQLHVTLVCNTVNIDPSVIPKAALEQSGLALELRQHPDEPADYLMVLRGQPGTCAAILDLDTPTPQASSSMISRYGGRC